MTKEKYKAYETDEIEVRFYAGVVNMLRNV